MKPFRAAALSAGIVFAALVCIAAVVNPPFFPQFGSGAPSNAVPKSQLYFDYSNSYKGYVYRSSIASWEPFGGGGGGGGCSGTAGALLYTANGTSCVGDVVTSDGAGNWTGLTTVTWAGNRVDDPGDITTSGGFNITVGGAGNITYQSGLDITSSSGILSMTGNSVNLEAAIGDMDITAGGTASITGSFSTTLGTNGLPTNVNGTPTLGDALDWTAAMSACTNTLKGMVPAPPNNTGEVLRGDCTWGSAPVVSPDLFAPPATTGFTVFNTDGVNPTFTQFSYATVLAAGASASPGGFRGTLESLPATPYVAIARLRESVVPYNFRSCGLVLNNGSTAYTIFNFQIGGGQPGWFVGHFTGSTFQNSLVTSTGAASYLEYFEIADDGTTRSYWISSNGINWAEMAQETHTNFQTPTEIGFDCETVASGGPTAGFDNEFLNVLYWSVT